MNSRVVISEFNVIIYLYVIRDYTFLTLLHFPYFVLLIHKSGLELYYGQLFYSLSAILNIYCICIINHLTVYIANFYSA